MRHIRIRSHNDVAALRKIGRLVREDCVFAYPTDTIYGLGCNPLSQTAVERIYQIKGRSFHKPLLILLDHQSRVADWCEEIPDSAHDLMRLWPAPLTLILPVSKKLPTELLRGSKTLGFRVPASPLCREIVKSAGGALTSTSVNRADEPPLTTPEAIADRFESEIDLLVDAGVTPPSMPSTIVNCEADRWEVLRKGAFPLDKGR